MSLVEITPDAELPATADAASDPVTVSFFVPCYNEEANVLGTIEKLVAVTRELGLAYEILVFDDCSRDRTVQVVREYQSAHRDVPVRLFMNSVNRGVAWNFVEGAFHARGRHYRLVCGDDVEPVETLRKILERAGQADIIIPYHTQVLGRPAHRRFISRFYTVLVNLASGRKLHYYNGLPLFLRRDVMRFHVEATGSGYQAEFLLRLLQQGRTYIEIPLVASDREGSGSLNVRNFVSVGYTIAKIAGRRMKQALLG